MPLSLPRMTTVPFCISSIWFTRPIYQQILIEYLLCARKCFGQWIDSDEQEETRCIAHESHAVGKDNTQVNN